MTDHGAEAEDLLAQLGDTGLASPESEAMVAEAQVHATLAVAQRLADLLALLERGR